MTDFLSLYPQYNQKKQDRRQNNTSVAFDRRSGVDRRALNRNLNPQLEKDIKDVYTAFRKPEIQPEYTQKKPESKLETVMRLFPPARKFLSAFHGFGAGNWVYGLGMTYRFINESMEDLDDLKVAFKGGVDPYVLHQHPFWAVKGSLIDKTRVGKFLAKYDYTLYDLKPIQKLLVKAGITSVEFNEKNLYKFEGNHIANVLARASLRVPIQGVALFALMESYNVAKAKGKEKPKAALKAAIEIISIMTLSAIAGATGKPYGKIVEMACMGSGIMAGNKLAEEIKSRI